ncbi:peptide/nickel transport system ATP-binding protein [Saccharopolyspora antimicrobica]|uniref:Peptide/nickel transport system ATP-binding protein n=1 Tax=Saccharopolyspora antimicrobica TaxID=455193 RepID=A0A1I5I5L5_9PSEU|nr:ABC transporter ATP-binding protein [Saccharopolyspora antimicrobica]RKT83020.1 peptide/nickel transport system ATP-binding protein [Saccharopolyspora antimicrobica]SFO55853.1 peptide/nickel transport system ATP-binding protein [Saccharopolyspora antimicrobica]
MSDVLSFTDLRVRFRTEDGTAEAVRGISFGVAPGEILAVVGESGSGKSVTAMSALGLLPRTAEVTGRIELDGAELGEQELRRVRGKDIAMIFQEPMTSLNPVFTIGWQLVEAIRLHTSTTSAKARERAVELLDLVGIPEPARRLKHYPHQLSGGQRQRVMVAMALACEPKVLIADEPTTALDVTVQAEILALLRDLRDRLGTTILLITHDMGVVADLADRVVVMYRGEVVEEAAAADLFRAPQHEYTEALLAAVPRLEIGKSEEAEPAEPVLVVEDLVVTYGGQRAVDGVSLRIDRGEVLALVGESGSGKSTVGKCAARLLTPAEGRIVLNGQDISRLPARRLRPLRRNIGIVFQDPGSSLDPRISIADSIAEPLRLHRVARGRELDKRVDELLDAVELGASRRQRYPHELSGGQRQRVSIARALALEPELLIADEPTSALDVSVQDAVLELFQSLQARLNFSCLFISHDLAVVNMLARRVAVMRRGQVVEQGDTAQVLGNPEHEYTQRLLAAVPVPDPERQRERRLAGA